MTATTTRPTVHLVAGARPNFMKIAPLVRALRSDGRLRWKLVHTGQHFDHDMSAVFFEELGIPEPDVHFNCGGGSHAVQTGKVMQAFEQHCTEDRPDAVLVVGDVNSTLACAVVAKKAGIPLAHVAAGLRSGDLAMPEEINRIVTDALSDWLFATEPAALENLSRAGVAAERVFHVGHVMVDNVMHQAGQLQAIAPEELESSAIKQRLGPVYGVVTLHRPSNVDDPATLRGLIDALNAIAGALPLVFPVHPRTRARLAELGATLSPQLHLMPPQAYMSFLSLWKDAAMVLTDSGGLQEETTALGVPCLTLRRNTERPITVDEGSNTLAGTEPGRVFALAMQCLRDGGKRGRRPALWDGRAAHRIVDTLAGSLA